MQVLHSLNNPPPSGIEQDVTLIKDDHFFEPYSIAPNLHTMCISIGARILIPGI